MYRPGNAPLKSFKQPTRGGPHALGEPSEFQPMSKAEYREQTATEGGANVSMLVRVGAAERMEHMGRTARLPDEDVSRVEAKRRDKDLEKIISTNRLRLLREGVVKNVTFRVH